MFRERGFSLPKKLFIMEEYLRIGIITKPHGVRGEVKVIATTDDLARFQTVPKVFLTVGSLRVETKIESVKYQSDRVILKFSAIQSMEEAERYRDGEIWIDRADSPAPKEGEYFISDLIGISVYRADESLLGIVTDIEENPANPILCIKLSSGKILRAPFVRAFLLSVDIGAKKMTMDLPDGLEEACTSTV